MRKRKGAVELVSVFESAYPGVDWRAKRQMRCTVLTESDLIERRRAPKDAAVADAIRALSEADPPPPPTV
jgi:hypothetical protein